MHRRSFLKGAAALAAAPMLPAATASAVPVSTAIVADNVITANHLRSCFVVYENGFGVFDAAGVRTVSIGMVEDLGRVLLIKGRG